MRDHLTRLPAEIRAVIYHFLDADVKTLFGVSRQFLDEARIHILQRRPKLAIIFHSDRDVSRLGAFAVTLQLCFPDKAYAPLPLFSMPDFPRKDSAKLAILPLHRFETVNLSFRLPIVLDGHQLQSLSRKIQSIGTSLTQCAAQRLAAAPQRVCLDLGVAGSVWKFDENVREFVELPVPEGWPNRVLADLQDLVVCLEELDDRLQAVGTQTYLDERKLSALELSRLRMTFSDMPAWPDY